jgi:hypothetical protein
VSLGERALSLARPASERVEGSAWITFSSSPAFTFALWPLGLPLIALTTLLIYRFAKRQGGTGPFAPLYATELVNAAVVIIVGAPLLLCCYLLMRASGSWSLIDTPITIAQGCWAFILSACSLQAVMGVSRGGAARAIVQGWGVLVIGALLLACLGTAFAMALS